MHIPYHDPWAVGLAVRVVATWQPDLLIYNGDLLDFYAVSFFDKDPKQLADGGLQKEIDRWAEVRASFRQALPTEAKEEFVPGNHELRLHRYLCRNSALHDLRVLELPSLLGLTEMGIRYHADEISLANGNLVVRHGSLVRKQSGASARAELEQERYTVSTVTGHTHRLGSVMVRTRNGVVGAWENGCLCGLNPEYAKRPDWQHGLTLVDVDGDAFHAFNVPFLGEGAAMKAFVNGQKVRP